MHTVARLLLVWVAAVSFAPAVADVIVPLEKVVDEVRASYPDSKVLEAELKEKDHAFTYEIEIVDKAGVVRELYFDARNGELLRTKQE
ncbi:MAG: PepSY domain-containing protein [Gammaproteobacteria bacterium]|nr:PepSY domain-containing protein [Gammaproteobacteria bacterium]